MKKRLDEYEARGGGMGMGAEMGMPEARPAGLSLRNLRTFSSFKNSVFRLYFSATLTQMIGMNMQMMARSLLIFRLTDSAFILGAMSLAHAIPMVSLSLFGGVIADRVQKKYVLIIGQVASGLLSLGVALSLTLGYLSSERTFTILGIVVPSWSILVVASVLQGVVMALMMPSRQSILPEIVGEEQLMNAISLNTMGMNTLRLFAPAIAGFLIEGFGFEAIYYITGGTYLLSTIFVAFLPLTSSMTIRGGGAFANIKEGLKYIRNQTTILFILGFTLLGTILSMPFMQLMPVFTEKILGVGASGLGVLMSVSGAGSIVSSLVFASLPNKRRGLMMMSSSVILGFALVAFSFSSIWPLSLTMIVFVGMGQMGQMALSNTLIQYYVDPDYRGRVMSILLMQFGLMSFSTFLAGALAETFGIQWAVGGFAIGLIFMAIMALAFLRRIRNLD